jgi:hypothetical protein
MIYRLSIAGRRRAQEHNASKKKRKQTFVKTQWGDYFIQDRIGCWRQWVAVNQIPMVKHAVCKCLKMFEDMRRRSARGNSEKRGRKKGDFLHFPVSAQTLDQSTSVHTFKYDTQSSIQSQHSWQTPGHASVHVDHCGSQMIQPQADRP